MSSTKPSIAEIDTGLQPDLLDTDPYEPSRIWRSLGLVAVVLPIVVAGIRAVATGWMPVGDDALLAVRAADVATRHHPWLGSWTSASLALGIDVNNPGPLYYDLVSPFMWTLGRAFGYGVGVAVGVATINAVTAVAIVLAGRRIGGWRAERWMLLLVAALTWSMGSELLIDIWQPHALLLPFCLLVVLTIGVATGDMRLLPWWIAVASLVVETHVAYVYVVATLTIVVVVAVVARLREANRESGSEATRRLLLGRTAVISVVVLIVAWSQPLIEQLFGPGEGNLQRLATHAGGGELTVGAGTAVRIVAAVTSIPPFWTRFGFEDVVPSTPITQTAAGPTLVVPGLPSAVVSVVSLAIVFGLLVWLWLALRRPAQRVARLAVGISSLLLLVSIAGLTIQTVSATGLGNHQVRSLFAIALIVHVSILWGLVEWGTARWASAGDRQEDGQRWVDIGVLGLVGVLCLANLPYHAHALGPTADREAADTLERTFDDLDGFDPPGPVLFDTDNLRVFEPYSAAVMMRLAELGVEFHFVEEGMIRQFGEGRRVDGSEVGHVRQYERSDALLYDGDDCQLSLRSGVPAADEARADELIAAAAADLASGTVAVDIDGLPEDVAGVVEAAVFGDTDAAFRVVADDLLPSLVAEQRLEQTPAIADAVAERDTIVSRVNSTLLIVTSAC